MVLGSHKLSPMLNSSFFIFCVMPQEIIVSKKWEVICCHPFQDSVQAAKRRPKIHAHLRLHLNYRMKSVTFFYLHDLVNEYFFFFFTATQKQFNAYISMPVQSVRSNTRETLCAPIWVSSSANHNHKQLFSNCLRKGKLKTKKHDLVICSYTVVWWLRTARTLS